MASSNNTPNNIKLPTELSSTLAQLAQFYAKTLLSATHIKFDMLFGPAYKGIPLASATAVAMAQLGHDIAFSYNRKEAKDHGEGGSLVGAKLAGNVVIIDDVISAGTSVRESVELIKAAGATPAAVLIALDRMERGGNADQIAQYSAVEEVQQKYNMPVIAIANLNDLLNYLNQTAQPELTIHQAAVANYRQQYGV
ncbi:hypothetical protein ACTFIZ_007526 [Dictyostelium cf. discoideum]